MSKSQSPTGLKTKTKTLKEKDKQLGFPVEEIWNLDWTFCKWITPRLIYLRDNGCGVTCGETEEEHKKNINLMIQGFKISLDEDQYFSIDKKKDEKLKRAFYLFGKYGRGLWD